LTTVPENLTTWTIARFAVTSLRINILKLRGFSVKTQLCYLTNQLRVSDTVLYPSLDRSQEYREKEIIQLQYRPEISDRTVHYTKYIRYTICTGLFINPSGISELDCASTKTDTAERSISIDRESLQVFFCTRVLGVLAGSTARG